MPSSEPSPSRRSLSLPALAALFVVGGFVVQETRMGFHPRLWSHLAYGHWTLAHANPPWDIPETDHLSSFSLDSLDSIDPSWLSRVVLARVSLFGEELAGNDAIRRLEGGVEMLRLLHALLVLLFALLLLAAYRRQCGARLLASAGLVLLALVSPPVPGALRPELFGLVCFAAVLWGLSGPRKSWWMLVWVPLLFALWTNLHSSFLPGLMLLLVFFLGRIVDVCIKASSWNVLWVWRDAQVWLLLLVLLLSVCATFCNPWGRNLYIPDEHDRLGIAALVKEYVLADMPGWRPLDFSLWEARSFCLLGSLVLLTLSQAVSPRSFSGSQLLLLLSFALLPLFLSRLIVWWFPLVPWLLLPLWPRTSEERKGSDSGAPRPALLGASLLLAAFLAWLLPFGWLFTGRPRSLALTLSEDTPWRVALQLREPLDSERRWLPVLADRLRNNYPGGTFKGVVFTSTTTGDFLLWALPSDWPVFMFSEVQFFGQRTWQDYLAIRKPEPDWWEILDRRGVNLIVLDRKADAALATALARDTAWEIVQGEASPGRGLLVALRKNPL